MSTQINSYIVLGVRLDYKEFNRMFRSLCNGDDSEAFDTFVDPYCDNAFREDCDPHNGLSMLYDGRDGDYVVIGEILHKTPNHTWFESPVVLDFAEIHTKAPKVSERIFEEFGIRESSQVIVVSHFR